MLHNLEVVAQSLLLYSAIALKYRSYARRRTSRPLTPKSLKRSKGDGLIRVEASSGARLRWVRALTIYAGPVALSITDSLKPLVSSATRYAGTRC